MARIRSRRRRAILVGLLSALLLGGLVSLVTLLVGKVQGTEFAPTHFTARTFSFWELPILHLQVSPIRRNAETISVTNYLRSQNLVSVPKQAPGAGQWHLVELRRGINSPAPADAEILISYLKLEDPDGPIWEQWSSDNPAAARVLWPVVQRLSERELYILLPELFELASHHTNPTQLASEIDRYLRDAYAELAIDLRAADHRELAAAVLADAAQDFPDDPRIDELRKSVAETSRP
ncbi:hypothetical protein [Candidatus Laterigemmans baculatus]|uniref:hypothetical protein n=1 Tax=Candidatus Laterigemmans baculatus TaxID=2770505 RepID=UPI0013D8F20F|nr:hypothetical protein [Candidatus Laterigemmans baculatus]